METDRGAVLTIRAASKGIIDFSKARLHDVNWWRYSNTLIKAMSNEIDLEAIKAAYEFQCALIANGSLNDQSFKQMKADAVNSFNELVNILQPWSARSTKDIQQSELSKLTDMYKSVFGDPSDPEVMEKIKRDIALELEGRKQVAVETDEQRVDRLIREQHLKKAGKKG